jgi:hypothetical protein
MIEQLGVGVDVALEVHGHEPGQLDEARIHPAHEAGVRPGHAVDDVALEPFDQARLGVLVDQGRVAPGFDRPAHERRRGGPAGVALRRHQRRRGERLDGGLADRHDVGVVADEADQLDQVLVEVEGAERERDVTGVAPVGEVEIVLLDHRLDGAAEQGRIVPPTGVRSAGPWDLVDQV